MDEHVHAHHVACQGVLRHDDATAPVVVEGRLLPLGCRCSVDVAAAVGAVDEEEQALLSQVLMAYPIHHGLVARLAVTLVGADAIVGVLAPQEVDVGGAIPVLGGERHAGAIVGLQQGRVDEVVGIHHALGQSAGHLAIVHRVFQLLGVVLALEASLATDVVDEHHVREFTVNLVLDAIGDGTARLAYDDVLLRHARLVDQATHECQCHEGR